MFNYVSLYIPIQNFKSYWGATLPPLGDRDLNKLELRVLLRKFFSELVFDNAKTFSIILNNFPFQKGVLLYFNKLESGFPFT